MRAGNEQLPGLPSLPQAAKFGVRENGKPDRDGSYRRHPPHIRQPGSCGGHKDRAAVQGIDRRRLYGSGPVWPGRTADYPLLRSDGGGNAVLSASGWRLTAVSQQILPFGLALIGALLLSALSLVGARSGFFAK